MPMQRKPKLLLLPVLVFLLAGWFAHARWQPVPSLDEPQKTQPQKKERINPFSSASLQSEKTTEKTSSAAIDRKNTVKEQEIIDELPLETEEEKALAGATTPSITTVPPSGQEDETQRKESTADSPPPAQLSPELAALKDIQNIQPVNRNLVGFATRRQPQTDTSEGVNNNTDESLSTAANSPVMQPRLTGQPRGYAMLYMMHPKARQTVEAQVQNLIEANIQQVYIGVLVDGTFREDHNYLQDVLQRLHDAGAEITLEQYLVSGPTMRQINSPVESDFANIDPIEFREYFVRDDEYIKARIKEIARKAKTSFEKNNALSPTNISLVSVMLEDNLDSDSYRYMRSMVATEIGDTARFVRNACPGCWQGNDDATSGDPLELHEVKDFDRLNEGDGYTLDGVNVTYPADETAGDIDVEQLRQMLRDSFGKGHRFFGLWRKGYQGLEKGSQKIKPDDRTFLIPTPEQLSLERTLLREGLVSAQ